MGLLTSGSARVSVCVQRALRSLLWSPETSRVFRQPWMQPLLAATRCVIA
jgi:hypothetical protein